MITIEAFEDMAKMFALPKAGWLKPWEIWWATTSWHLSMRRGRRSEFV